MRAETGFHKQVQNIIDDPATSDALRTYALSALNRDPVDVVAELDILHALFTNRVSDPFEK